MVKDLISSSIVRQNILNNTQAVEKIKKVIGLTNIVSLKRQVIDFFEVKEKIYLVKYMAKNSYWNLISKMVILCELMVQNNFGREINFPTKIVQNSFNYLKTKNI